MKQLMFKMMKTGSLPSFNLLKKAQGFDADQFFQLFLDHPEFLVNQEAQFVKLVVEMAHYERDNPVSPLCLSIKAFEVAQGKALRAYAKKMLRLRYEAGAEWANFEEMGGEFYLRDYFPVKQAVNC